MKRKTIHCISSLTALSLLSGTCAVPVAAEDIQGKIAIVQEKEKLTENDLEQVYHYSYESLGKNLPYTKADTLFSDGFTPSSLIVADWKNYEGDIQVTVTDKDGKETVLQAQEKEEVDLTSYGDVQKVALQPDGTIEDDSSFDGLSVSGKADPTKDQVSTTLSVKHSEDGEEFSETTSASATTQMEKENYEAGTPEFSAEKTELSYGEETTISVNGITGKGKIPESYEVRIQIPEGVHLETVTAPAFDHASCKLYNGEEEILDSNVSDKNITELTLKIQPDGDFSQKDSLKLLVKDTENSKEKTSVSIKGSASVKTATGQTIENPMKDFSLQLSYTYDIGVPSITVSSDSVEGHEDVYTTYDGFQGKGQSSSYTMQFTIPQELTVATIDVPEFQDADGNVLDRTITVNGIHPSIINKKIYVYDKISDFQITVHNYGKDFSQTKAMVIRSTNNASMDTTASFDTNVAVGYGNGLSMNASIHSNSILFKKAEEIVPPTPDPDPDPKPSPKPDQPSTDSKPSTDKKEDSKKDDTKKEDTKKDTDKKQDAKKETEVVTAPTTDSATNLITAPIVNPSKAPSTKNKGKVKGTSIVSELRTTADDSMDTTEIQDDFSTETASAANNGVEASPTPAESIKKSGAEEATEQVKKTVDNNRGLQIFLILAGIVAAGAAVIALVFSHGHKKEEPSEEQKEEENK